VGKDAFADQSGDAAQQNAGGDDDGEIGAIAERGAPRGCGAIGARGGRIRGGVEAIGRRRLVMLGFDGDGRRSPDANLREIIAAASRQL
jgi:hypothetical protein